MPYPHYHTDLEELQYRMVLEESNIMVADNHINVWNTIKSSLYQKNEKIAELTEADMTDLITVSDSLVKSVVSISSM